MKRCTNCFRYSLGDPAFCNHCGCTYDVRLCPKGHKNPRGAQYCADCGSSELTTAAPTASVLFKLSQWTLRAFVVAFVSLVLLAGALGLVYALDWNAIASRLLLLLVMLVFLYWAMTLLPGPVKKVGKAAGRKAWQSMKKEDKHTSRR